MKKKDLLILIPARSGSKGIKNKNIIKINNKPLIYFSIKFALKYKSKNSILFCSTDSKKIKNICEKYNLKIPFLRPKNISKDKSRDIEYLNHTLNEFNKIGYRFSNCLILRPTSPLRSIKILNMAYKKFKQKKFDSLRSIILSPYPVFKQWFINKDLIKPVIKSNIKEHYNAPRQILKKTYAQSGNFEFININYRTKLKSFSGKRIGYYITPQKFECDIDELSDINKYVLKK